MIYKCLNKEIEWCSIKRKNSTAILEKDVSSVATKVFSASAKMEGTFTTALNNKDSAAYRDLEANLQAAVSY